MKSKLLGATLPTLLVTALSCWSCDWNPDGPGDVGNSNSVAAESFSFQFNAARGTRLRLEAINGSVRVTGSDDPSVVTVSGERQVGSHSRADAETHLGELEVRVNELGGEIHAETVQPRQSHGRNYVINYEISVPRDMEVGLNNINGEIRLRDLQGRTDVDLVNGQIDAHLSPPAGGIVDMSTVNGTISLRIPTSTSAQMTANVVNGRIEVNNLSLHNGRSTRTTLQGTLGAGGGMIRLSTVNGNIRVEGFEAPF